MIPVTDYAGMVRAAQEEDPVVRAGFGDILRRLIPPRATIKAPKGQLPAAERALPDPNAKFPVYAEEYPAPGPPVERFKKSGEPYPGRAPTEESQAFIDERTRIMKEMKQGYTPYYDPSQRYYVDPKNYPLAFNTLDVIPKRADTVERHLETIGAKETLANLRAAFKRGMKLGDTQHWYAVGQLEADFVKELGEQAGRDAFKQRFATSMAATTTGLDPTANLLMASYLNFQRMKGRPYPTGTPEIPYPVRGGTYGMMPNVEMHQRIFDAGGHPALGLGNPKRYDFSGNFMGHTGPITIDEQMVKGMIPKYGAEPPSNTYGLIENVVGREAKRQGVPGSSYQGVTWAGFKDEPGKPMIAHINDAIERTHRLTGMPRDEIVRRALIRGEIPLYGAAGAAALPVIPEVVDALGNQDPNR